MNQPNQTSKQRAQRIQIDYYKQKTDLDRYRRYAVITGIVSAGAYAVFLIWNMPAGSRADQESGNPLAGHISTGPLADAHASFEHQCESCHADFTPLDAAAPVHWLPLIGIDENAARAHLESSCQTCHPVGTHFRTRMNDDFAKLDQNCSLCHEAHRGRDFELTKIDQQKCAACHRDLQRVTKDAVAVRRRVGGFDKDRHGDFFSLRRTDPGRIRFSHAQHLMPGQVGVDVRGGMTLDRLSPSDRARYRISEQTDQDLVRLQCDDCHRIVGQDIVGRLGDDLKSVDVEMLGRSMSPIDFERHCVACHVISPGIADATTDGRTSGENLRLPHAETSGVMTNMIAAAIDGARATGRSRHRRDNSKSKPPPGFGSPADPVSDWRVTQPEIANARRNVRQQCLECHDAGSITDEAIEAANSDLTSDMIPTRWLRRGLYDHAAHRQIDCRYCHAEAYPPNDDMTQSEFDPDAREKPMIAGIESCQGCHRTAGTAAPVSLNDPLLRNMPTWASDRCTTCHRYHAPMKGSDGSKRETETTEPGDLARTP